MISIEGLLGDEQGLSMGERLTVKFRQPSHEYLRRWHKFYILSIGTKPLDIQVHSCMSVLEFSVYAWFCR
jgi:hypothetical protein